MISKRTDFRGADGSADAGPVPVEDVGTFVGDETRLEEERAGEDFEDGDPNVEDERSVDEVGARRLEGEGAALHRRVEAGGKNDPKPSIDLPKHSLHCSDLLILQRIAIKIRIAIFIIYSD
jgi:hypothetical protein